MEIHQSFEALGDIETYIRRSRYAKDGVSQSRQLRYHAENYLNEAYILKSRLKAYFVRLRKSYRRTLTARQAGVVNEMTASVTSAFEAITITRGKHVHERRYLDHDLQNAESWEFIAQAIRDRKVARLASQLARDAYKRALMRWKKESAENRRKIAGLLNAYFAVLYLVTFDENGDFKDPAAALPARAAPTS
ncbi:MAG TPA: hypothetical protein VOA80_03330 [Thermoanaerobaculia bacterium]|nr:hypothetical protein [Thermoanaerobaculia bacterium]